MSVCSAWVHHGINSGVGHHGPRRGWGQGGRVRGPGGGQSCVTSVDVVLTKRGRRGSAGGTWTRPDLTRGNRTPRHARPARPAPCQVDSLARHYTSSAPRVHPMCLLFPDVPFLLFASFCVSVSLACVCVCLCVCMPPMFSRYLYLCHL